MTVTIRFNVFNVAKLLFTVLSFVQTGMAIAAGTWFALLCLGAGAAALSLILDEARGQGHV